MDLLSLALPELGQPVSLPELLALAKFHGKADILEALSASTPPESTFASDGCSMWPDSWLGHNIYPPCFWHDVRYWCGTPGDEVARLFADAELAKDVAVIADPDLARLMFTGVGFGGTDKIKSPFRWGYGRTK